MLDVGGAAARWRYGKGHAQAARIISDELRAEAAQWGDDNGKMLLRMGRALERAAGRMEEAVRADAAASPGPRP